ncbi:MAG: hypothetical protein Q9219_000760 [cf. Caloplaca sp. 3 TL-2023]
MTHPTLTATHVVVTTVANTGVHPTTMSKDTTTTQSSFPSSINRPSSLSASATQDSIFPTTLVTDTSTLPSTSLIFDDPNATFTTSTVPSFVTSSEVAASTSAPPVAPAASSSQPVLTKPQIAGVTVGSVAAAGLVFGLLALLFCLRGRRRKRERESIVSFGNDKIIVDQPRTPSPQPALAIQDIEQGTRRPEPVNPRNGNAQVTPTRRQSSRWSLWPPKTSVPDNIGVAVAHNPNHPARNHSPVTPVSIASYETTSPLLPDKPNYSLYPAPLRPYNQNVSPIEGSDPTAAGFARPLPVLAAGPRAGGHGSLSTSQTSLPLCQPTIRSVPSDPFLDSSFASRLADPPQFPIVHTEKNELAGSLPVEEPHGQSTKSATINRKPVPARLSLEPSQADATIERTDWAAVSPAQSPTLGNVTSSSRAVPLTRRKSSGMRTFLSTSDTSFEDADSDEDTPVTQAFLSPVIESPPSRPRATGVRHPVPTSAAESPSANRTMREARRVQIELNPDSDQSKGRAKASLKTLNPRDKPLPQIPQTNSTGLKERQQVPHSKSEKVDPAKPGSAKHQILVAPGLEGIENVGTPRSKASSQWTPMSTPTKRGR